MRRLGGGLVLAAALGLAVGCRTTPQTAAPAPPMPAPAVEVPAFFVAESMLDTWNTLGQVLVSIDGVRYEARSQMLGLYQLRYRGEPLLLVAQAVPLGPDSPAMRTKVRALSPTGAPLRSSAAADLVALLAARVAAEAPGYRQPVLPRAGAIKPARATGRR